MLNQIPSSHRCQPAVALPAVYLSLVRLWRRIQAPPGLLIVWFTPKFRLELEYTFLIMVLTYLQDFQLVACVMKPGVRRIECCCNEDRISHRNMFLVNDMIDMLLLDILCHDRNCNHWPVTGSGVWVTGRIRGEKRFPRLSSDIVCSCSTSLNTACNF